MLRGLARELAAEFLGTFVLIVFGVAVVAQVLLGDGDSGEYLSINLGWGLAVTMGVLVAGGVTGAHLNPAVTLAMAMRRGFAWNKVLPYWVAQVAGAFVASAVVYAIYHDALWHYAESQPLGTYFTQQTAGIWATYPQSYVSTFPTGLSDQIVGTALLLMCIFAISDARNLSPPPAAGAVLVGASVVLIGMTFGHNCGYAINPARDFGPRLFTYIAGWGADVFRWGDNFWWVPIVGPLVGGVLGGVIYDALIAWHHPPQTGAPAGKVDVQNRP